MKVCVRCRCSKPLDQFVKASRNKDGYSGRCKECHRAATAPYDAKRVYTPEQLAKKRQYHKEWSKRDGSAEAIAAAKAKWLESNKDRKAASNASWKKVNKAKVAASTRERQARQLKATPGWADQHRIRCFYYVAEALASMWGEPFEVDHVIPLRGKNVCGLHAPSNLRVIPARENRSKGNRLDEALLA